MKKIILIILLSLISLPAVATDCPTNTKKLVVYFSNGMFNDKREAVDSLSALDLATRSKFRRQGYSINYELAYNQNEPWHYQLLEVFIQKRVEKWESFFSWLSGLTVAPDWFNEAIKSISNRANYINYIIDSDLNKQVQNYNSELLNCKRVLIVVHSQGNFYANSAWKIIYGLKMKGKYMMKNFPAMGLLSVATPASHVGSGLRSSYDHAPITSYVTLNNDWIINAVRFFEGDANVLDANYANSNVDADWTHHSFVDSYINGNNTSGAIISKAQSIANNLETLPFQRQAFISSALASAGYQKDQKILELEFSNSNIYRYYNIPSYIYQNLLSAPSHGTYFNLDIRDYYDYKKVYEDG